MKKVIPIPHKYGPILELRVNDWRFFSNDGCEDFYEIGNHIDFDGEKVNFYKIVEENREHIFVSIAPIVDINNVPEDQELFCLYSKYYHPDKVVICRYLSNYTKFIEAMGEPVIKTTSIQQHLFGDCVYFKSDDDENFICQSERQNFEDILNVLSDRHSSGRLDEIKKIKKSPIPILMPKLFSQDQFKEFLIRSISSENSSNKNFTPIQLASIGFTLSTMDGVGRFNLLPIKRLECIYHINEDKLQIISIDTWKTSLSFEVLLESIKECLIDFSSEAPYWQKKNCTVESIKLYYLDDEIHLTFYSDYSDVKQTKIIHTKYLHIPALDFINPSIMLVK